MHLSKLTISREPVSYSTVCSGGLILKLSQFDLSIILLLVDAVYETFLFVLSDKLSVISYTIGVREA